MFDTTYTGPNRWANLGETFNMTFQDVIDYGYDIGLADYPVWVTDDETTDTEKREWLNARILDHFCMREIRSETPAQFILWINRIMREQMPMINPMFEVAWDRHFSNDDYGYLETRTVTRNASGTVTDTSSGTDSSTDTSQATGSGTTASDAYASTNPRQTMVGKNATDYYDSGTRTNGSNSTTSSGSSSFSGTTSSQSSGTSTDNETVTETKHGYDGTVARWTEEWSRIANPLQRVFDVLEPCFSQLVTDHFNVW